MESPLRDTNRQWSDGLAALLIIVCRRSNRPSLKGIGESGYPVSGATLPRHCYLEIGCRVVENEPQRPAAEGEKSMDIMNRYEPLARRRRF
jgi:hypothetical protein